MCSPRTRCSPRWCPTLEVSHARRLRLVVGTVSRQPDQWREGAERQNPAGQKPCGAGAPHVGASGARQSRRARRLLSTDAGQARRTEGDHRHGSQTGARRVSLIRPQPYRNRFFASTKRVIASACRNDSRRRPPHSVFGSFPQPLFLRRRRRRSRDRLRRQRWKLRNLNWTIATI